MSLVAWAARRHADVSVDRGSVALTLVAYTGDGAPAQQVIGDLEVRDGPRRAAWHATSSVHGWVEAPPGTREVVVNDPAGRWLPRRLSVTFPDRAGAGPDPGATFLTEALFPSAGLPIPPRETVLWGHARTAAGAPLPFAFVQVTHLGRSWRGLTDVNGLYALWLVGEAVDPADASPFRTVHVYPRSAALDPRAPAATIPIEVDTIVPGSAAFLALYGAAISRTQRAETTRRTRFPDHVL